jgi:hypothetical protein
MFLIVLTDRMAMKEKLGRILRCYFSSMLTKRSNI